MRLRFATEDLHFVLVQAFVRAELQLRRTVLEVHIADGVTHVFAPVARFRTLEGRAAALRETRFGAVARSVRRCQEIGRTEAGE